mgnify:CR=1 FL=1|tara:strand:+ start:158 stop:820 length:663 start_codon:yes stop_codon:yes gene_type:complete
MLRHFKIFRDVLVRKTYEETLSSCISSLIIKNTKKNKVKILDFGSGYEPSVMQLVRKKLLPHNINLLSHGFDIYSEEDLKDLNTKEGENEKYFNAGEISKNQEHYDFAVISDTLHHIDIDNKKEIKRILEFLKSKSDFLIIKDHFQYGFISNQILRFMDFFGNFYNKIQTPKRYYKKKEFEDLINELNLVVKDKILDKRYHPSYFLFLANKKYHFVYLIK